MAMSMKRWMKKSFSKVNIDLINREAILASFFVQSTKKIENFAKNK